MRAVLAHETVEPAIVVAVSVTENEPVQPVGVDVEQIEIAVEHLRRIAEIEQVLRLFPCLFGFEMQRQAPFRGKRGHLPPRHLADMLDRDGSRTPVEFDCGLGLDEPIRASIVQAATKWKRWALQQFQCA